MSLVLIVGLLLLNTLISAVNGYSTGRSWDDAKSLGGFPRVLAWAGAVMSACGFTYVYLALFAFGCHLAGSLTDEALQALLSLGYLAIILPVLGSGCMIWIESVRRAWHTKRMSDMVVGGWNTYAQFSNLSHAFRDIPNAWDAVEAFFGKRAKSKDSEKATVLLLAVLALAAGVLTTLALVSLGRRHSRQQLNGELAASRARRAEVDRPMMRGGMR